MYVPLEISVKDIEKTPYLDDLIQKKVEKLERVCDHLASCRVSIEKPHEHMESGNPYRVRIDMRVPPAHELVAKQEPGQGDMHHDIDTVVRQVFSKAERQLKKLVEKQNRKTKTHEAQQARAFVTQLFPQEGYGFLKAVDDDRDIYFHENSVADNRFEDMREGTGVWYQYELGEKGPQATTVRIVEKP